MARSRAKRADLMRLVGELDERKALQILALHPTLAEIERAVLWTAGDGGILAKRGHPLTATAADVLDMLSVEDEEEPSPGP